jgi:hypothetical protein
LLLLLLVDLRVADVEYRGLDCFAVNKERPFIIDLEAFHHVVRDVP